MHDGIVQSSISGIQHSAFLACDSFNSAGLVGSVLEFGFADEENVYRQQNSGERSVEFDDFLIPIRDVRLDYEQIDVAVIVGVAAGLRPEEDDLRGLRDRNQPLDGGLQTKVPATKSG